MHSLDLPPPPPPGGKILTLSGVASGLVEHFEGCAQDDDELGRGIGGIINTMLETGLIREWGFENGRTVYAADAAFDFDTRPHLDLPLPPRTHGQAFYIRFWYD